MGVATIAGLVIGFAGILVGYIMEGGQLGALVGPTAFLIVIGGTVGAATVSHSVADMLRLPKLVMATLKTAPDRRLSILEEMVKLAEMARRDGLLVLESHQSDDMFFNRAVTLVVDGTDSDTTKDILLLDVEAMETRHEQSAEVFTTMGGFAPTMGILGTVMGLVMVLGHLEDPSKLGHSIAVAFLATLYGVGSANLLFLPLASKLKLISKMEVNERMMVIEGALAIQAGDNPRILKEKLTAYIPPAMRNQAAPVNDRADVRSETGMPAMAEGGE